MLEVLAYLFEQFYHAEGEPDVSLLATRLASAGFDQDDIAQAVGWLAELNRIDTTRYAALGDMAGRHFHPDELARFDEEALDYWLYLQSAHVLGGPEREMALDLVMHAAPGEISQERLQLIVLMVVWRKRDELSNLLIEEILFGREGLTQH
ncbi:MULTISPECIES: DUF494 domain-containing protein [Silvimonas]|uniref:DUF494 domain-containing protein n=1 Tax=Silvimonas TaxID=300264 RepID=UPI0024B3B3E8|nr:MULTISPECIES: DUF494 domain-containing protein [Silvimonas]MDR3427559.1 DUF494 domain-containing protein [Silvimonas sp.]